MTEPKTITLELPTTLARRLEEQQVSEAELQALLITVLETWLSEQTLESVSRPFADSAAPFARRLVERNRALFEELAHLGI